MKIKNISYYSKERKTLSLRTLQFRAVYNITDIFIAAEETNGSQELLMRLQKVFSNEIILLKETESFIKFYIDNSNYLKFRISRNEETV